MSSVRRYLCPTPTEHCSGGHLITDQQLKSKCHTSRREAFRCYKRYLIHILHYVPLGSHDMIPPDGSEVLMLGKVGKFGGEVVLGKHGEGKSGNRFMPDSHDRTGNRGLIY